VRWEAYVGIWPDGVTDTHICVSVAPTRQLPVAGSWHLIASI
jgi:hypothetical protein